MDHLIDQVEDRLLGLDDVALSGQQTLVELHAK